MIDWSKPIRTKLDGSPAELIKTLDGYTRPRVVLIYYNNGSVTADCFSDDTGVFENVPERREHWVNVFKDDRGRATTSSGYDSKEQAVRYRCEYIDYLGEPVLLHVDNPYSPPAPLRLQIGRYYVTRNGVKVQVTHFDSEYKYEGHSFPFFGHPLHSPSIPMTWKADGSYLPSGQQSEDIVAEIPEPQK